MWYVKHVKENLQILVSDIIYVCGIDIILMIYVYFKQT